MSPLSMFRFRFVAPTGRQLACAVLVLPSLVCATQAAALQGRSALASHTDRAATQSPARLVVDRDARTIRIRAVLQAHAFAESVPPDHQYHALVHVEGSAAPKALFVTEVSDTTLARTMRELGAEDAGGVPMSAWSLRWVPLVSAPTSRAMGTPVNVTVSWEGEDEEHPLGELLRDPGGAGLDLRFAGHEEHKEHWDSGCIVCLFSCPGGVVANAAYTIRDHQRAVTAFEPGGLLPPDGTEVVITFALGPAG